METVTLWTRRTPSPAARAFMTKAFSRELVADGYTPDAAAAEVVKRYPQLCGPEPTLVKVAKGQTDSAWETIDRLAKRRVDAGEAKTFAQGVDQVMQQDPALYVQYQEEGPYELAAPVEKAVLAQHWAVEELNRLAKAKVDAGTATTQAQAFVKALDERPDLFAAARRAGQ